MKKEHIELNNKTILVTGSPGFIGAFLVIRLLKEMTGGTVISLDNMNDYYDCFIYPALFITMHGGRRQPQNVKYGTTNFLKDAS